MTEKKLTRRKLKSFEPCTDGFEWWCKNCDGLETDKQLLKLFEYRADWANWLIVRLMNRKQKIRYAIYAAEQVIDIFEKKYPNDKRPREAIKAAKAVLKRDTKESRAAADAAADAAAGAAWDAARAAARAAGDAAGAAWDAAGAAGAVAKKKMQTKIIKYGIKLLEGK